MVSTLPLCHASVAPRGCHRVFVEGGASRFDFLESPRLDRLAIEIAPLLSATAAGIRLAPRMRSRLPSPA